MSRPVYALAYCLSCFKQVSVQFLRHDRKAKVFFQCYSFTLITLSLKQFEKQSNYDYGLVRSSGQN